MTGELLDTPEPQTIAISATATRRVTVRVTSTYPGEVVDGLPAFDELAVAEISFRTDSNAAG